MASPSAYTELLLKLLLLIFATDYSQSVNLTPGEECLRECTVNDVRACHFKFNVHHYQTLSRACYNCPYNTSDCARPDCVPGNGVMRQITVVNNRLPGPPIQVCVGDHIVVDVKNSLTSGDLSIHWHGMTMRAHNGSRGTPHMDGVPGVTQCPLVPGQTFRYDFSATEAGTHWWHAHTGFQRADGVYGGLIVREMKEPHLSLYDYDLPEHLILVQPWLHTTTESKYIIRLHSGGNKCPDSMIVNGQGPHQSPLATKLSQQIPYQRFKVEQDKRYRFRLLNTAGLNCPIVFSIDEHPFTVIATDGNPIVPVNASSLVIYSGERWDIIVTTNVTNGTYWMKFMGGVDCAGNSNCPTNSVHQFALLEYTDLQTEEDQPDQVVLAQMKSKPQFTKSIPFGVQINSINKACYIDKICAADLRSLSPLTHDLTSEKTDYTLYLSFEVDYISNMPEGQILRNTQINDISLKLPVSPLLTSNHDMSHFNAESPPDASMCNKDHCEVLHMYQVPLGATVDIVFIDEGKHGDENHPIHMHGHHFWVLAQDRPQDIDGAKITKARVMEMDQKGLIKRNLVNPVLKDSVTIPDAGFTVVRFKTYNPGYWLLHCHLLIHSIGGMSLILQVGDRKDIPPAPTAFPTCSDFNYNAMSTQVDPTCVPANSGCPTGSCKERCDYENGEYNASFQSCGDSDCICCVASVRQIWNDKGLESTGDPREFTLDSERFIVLDQHKGVTWQQARTLCQDSGHELAQPQIDVTLLASQLLTNHDNWHSLRYYWLGGKGPGFNITWLSGQVIDPSSPVWNEAQQDLQNSSLSTDFCVYIKDDGNPNPLGAYNCRDTTHMEFTHMIPLCEAN